MLMHKSLGKRPGIANALSNGSQQPHLAVPADPKRALVAAVRDGAIRDDLCDFLKCTYCAIFSPPGHGVAAHRGGANLSVFIVLRSYAYSHPAPENRDVS